MGERGKGGEGYMVNRRDRNWYTPSLDDVSDKAAISDTESHG